MSGYVASAGVVGPMGSSGLTLPSVEKVMKDLEGDDVSSRLLRATGGAAPRRVSFPEFAAFSCSRQLSVLKDTRATAIPPVASLPTASHGASVRSSAPSSAGLGPVPPSATGDGRSQHEVLQDFFQSLIINLGSGSGTSPNAPVTSLPTANGATSGLNGNTTP